MAKSFKQAAGYKKGGGVDKRRKNYRDIIFFTFIFKLLYRLVSISIKIIFYCLIKLPFKIFNRRKSTE
tara:strand:- start:452 stop:655 length:204 start_codon:yes stop_codon:yes gene_type:complete